VVFINKYIGSNMCACGSGCGCGGNNAKAEAPASKKETSKKGKK
jgi:hypothetical protein